MRLIIGGIVLLIVLALGSGCNDKEAQNDKQNLSNYEDAYEDFERAKLPYKYGGTYGSLDNPLDVADAIRKRNKFEDARERLLKARSHLKPEQRLKLGNKAYDSLPTIKTTYY